MKRWPCDNRGIRRRPDSRSAGKGRRRYEPSGDHSRPLWRYAWWCAYDGRWQTGRLCPSIAFKPGEEEHPAAAGWCVQSNRWVQVVVMISNLGPGRGRAGFDWSAAKTGCSFERAADDILCPKPTTVSTRPSSLARSFQFPPHIHLPHPSVCFIHPKCPSPDLPSEAP